MQDNVKARDGIARGHILGVAMTMLFCGASAAAAEVTLRMVGSFPIGPHPAAEIGNEFMKRVNEKGEGVVQIKFLGASDAIPTFDQPQALVNGVFDVWYGAPNYWAGVVPGGDITELSQFKIPDNGQSSDFYAFISGLYEKAGVYYLGHTSGDVGIGTHFLSTNVPTATLEDLKGQGLRVAPVMRHFIDVVGAEPITLPPSDVFSRA